MSEELRRLHEMFLPADKPPVERDWLYPMTEITDDQGNPRRLVYLGTYDGSTTALVIPAPIIERATKQLDQERARREKLANEARTAALRSARNQSRLKRALRAVFGRGRGRGR